MITVSDDPSTTPPTFQPAYVPIRNGDETYVNEMSALTTADVSHSHISCMSGAFRCCYYYYYYYYYRQPATSTTLFRCSRRRTRVRGWASYQRHQNPSSQVAAKCGYYYYCLLLLLFAGNMSCFGRSGWRTRRVWASYHHHQTPSRFATKYGCPHHHEEAVDQGQSYHLLAGRRWRFRWIQVVKSKTVVWFCNTEIKPCGILQWQNVRTDLSVDGLFLSLQLACHGNIINRKLSCQTFCYCYLKLCP